MSDARLFWVPNLHELAERRSELLDQIASQGYVVLRGICDRGEVRAGLAAVLSEAANGTVLATSAGSRDSVRANTNKWSIGGESPSQGGVARFMMTLYNPLAAGDRFGLHRSFQQLIQVRETLAGRGHTPMFDEQLPDGYFNATRVQLYPRGGGFMTAHTDSTARSTFGATDGDQFLQPLILLSERGTDFERGGAFVVGRDGERLDVEADGQSGDIVIYDERTMHGVADIDSHVSPDLVRPTGRVVALATIYR